jgi:hypothetical protein
MSPSRYNVEINGPDRQEGHAQVKTGNIPVEGAKTENEKELREKTEHVGQIASKTTAKMSNKAVDKEDPRKILKPVAPGAHPSK